MPKVVLVTGASSGIGKAVATWLTQKGYTVYGTGRNPENIKNYPFELVALDVTKIDTIQKVITDIVTKEGKLNVLINNAGMGITGPVEDTPTDEMRNIFDTNFFGAIDVMKCVLPQMRKQQSGLIVNITSIAGYMGLPFRGIYSATKGALELVTEAMRMEVKTFGIYITNVAPGDVATNIAAGRYHTPVFENSAYKEKYRENLEVMNTHVNKGMEPMVIAKKVDEIIRTKKPKIHYKVGGFMEKFSVILKRILSDKLYEKLLMDHYKL
ncbi:MAG: SDR family NAD(P)-dependent oxidoreductase [Flavobacteriaceae bacterium]|nr:MAG: SDR family NAD(P)-dependent oxidoreductase [Flavobacteriaceae bacterium]